MEVVNHIREIIHSNGRDQTTQRVFWRKYGDLHTAQWVGTMVSSSCRVGAVSEGAASAHAPVAALVDAWNAQANVLMR